MDYYSDFVEVKELSDTTSPTIIQFLKEQFSRHGIPDVLISDNVKCHHKSNGIAESAVKVTKSLFKKGFWDERDPWLALLECRNAPLETIGSNPAQRLNVSKNEDTHANSLNSTSTRCHGRCGGSNQAKKAESKELSWLNSKAVATTWSWSRGQSSTTTKKQELASRNSYQATVQQVLPGEDW